MKVQYLKVDTFEPHTADTNFLMTITLLLPSVIGQCAVY